MKMMRHAQLTNGAGLRATVTIDGVWQVGSYMNMSPVLRLQGRVEREDGTQPYMAVFDEVVAQLHIARMRPGVRIAVFVDPQNPWTWRSTGSAPVSSARRNPVPHRVPASRGRARHSDRRVTARA